MLKNSESIFITGNLWVGADTNRLPSALSDKEEIMSRDIDNNKMLELNIKQAGLEKYNSLAEMGELSVIVPGENTKENVRNEADKYDEYDVQLDDLKEAVKQLKKIKKKKEKIAKLEKERDEMLKEMNEVNKKNKDKRKRRRR